MTARKGCIEETKDQVVEIGHSIGFRPEPNPSVGKRLVAHAKEHGIVIEGFELAATLYDAQFVPPVCGERAVELLDDLLDPLHDAIEPDLLFNRAGPQEVVIAVIRGMPYKSAAEIGFSCHGQIGDLDINVAAVGPLHEQQLVRLICSFRLQLSEYLGGALRAVGDENFPLAGRAAVEERADHERTGERSRSDGVKIPLPGVGCLRIFLLCRKGLAGPQRYPAQDGQDPASHVRESADGGPSEMVVHQSFPSGRKR